MAAVIVAHSQAGQYPSMDTFQKDWHLMFHNAVTFNIEGSEVYEDAIALQACTSVSDSYAFRVSSQRC